MRDERIHGGGKSPGWVELAPSAHDAGVLLASDVEVPPQFIALCQTSGVSPQSTLRGMAAMLCCLRYDEDNRLLPLEAAEPSGR
ncbi:MAG: hypothetical protein JNM58_06030 [Xanthomonadaceae bacterium]|nr:hypothetical protein [Xanthomonadaceae bacterium]